MNFCDFVDYELLQRGMHEPTRAYTVEELHPLVAEVVLAAANRLTGGICEAVPEVGFELDLATDYDAATGLFVTDVYVTTVGTPPYGASAALLEQGFVYQVDDGTFHVNVTTPAEALGGPGV